MRQTGERAGSPAVSCVWPGAWSLGAAGLHAVLGGAIDVELSGPQGRISFENLRRSTFSLWVSTCSTSSPTHTPNILVNGNSILVTWDEQARAWFECPACGRRCKHLYLDTLACRICSRLDYASRHLHRSVPGVHRIMRWRRMSGIDPHPFAAIPKRPRHHARFHRIVARILLEERALLGHLQTVTHDLQRRARLRGMLPK